MPSPIYDVCVVGSGPGGGIAAHALTAHGLTVALVEAGPRLRAGVDYNAHAAHHADLDKSLDGWFHSPIPSVNRRSEREHFTPVGDRPAHGQLRAVGGRSLCWAGHSLRFGPLDYRSWPVSYDEVSPYYRRAERFMGVYGDRDGLSNMPDGEYLPGVPLRCGEQMLKRGVERLKQQGRRMEFVAQRKAILTRAHASKRTPCHYCGHCMAGCEVDAKYTSANTPIPLALRTGKLTLLTESMMTRIVLRKDERVVDGIEYQTKDGATQQLRCRALVLACSAVETARQLLLNTSREFPQGLANSSGQVGRNLTSHFGLTVNAFFPQLRQRDGSNDDGTDYYHGLLTGLYWDRPNPKFSGTYQVQCGSGMHPRQLTVRNLPGYGSQWKRALREMNNGHAGMNMQGSLLISPRKYVDLDPDRRDRFGMPLPRIHLHYEDNDLAMAQDAADTCEEIIRAAGGEVLSRPASISPSTLVIDSNHWVGTARMGMDPKTSVVDRFGRAHDVPNLFLGDASVFAAYPEKNPTLTNIALSWRMSDHLAELFRRGDLS